MNSLDAYDTPPQVARLLVEAADADTTPCQVLDPAMGKGNLLLAAQDRWGSQLIYAGVDVSAQIVRRVRSEHPRWAVGKCDFLNARSRLRTPILGMPNTKRYDRIVMNPPFSGRGGHSRTICVSIERAVRASVSMSFLIAATQYLADDGLLVALMPAGVLSAERDQAGRAFLAESHETEIVGKFPRTAFTGAYAQTVLLRLRRHRANSLASQAIEGKHATHHGGDRLRVTRGNVRMHEVQRFAADVGVPLVHTTHLAEGAASMVGPWVNSDARRIQGPAVLVPRVGTPRYDKVCLVPHGVEFAPSDCVVALHGPDQLVRASYLRISINWDSFLSLYGGSCARYLTMDRLLQWLEDSDIAAQRFNTRPSLYGLGRNNE